MVYVDWQERLKTKAELFGNWDRNASLDIAKVWGHRQDWRLQDWDLAHLRCRGGSPHLLKSRSPEIILHHFVDTADTCRLLLGLATAYQQMSFAFRSMDALIIWNHNAICSFGWHSTTHLFAVHCRVLSQVCWLKEWYLGHQISSLAALRWSANADCHMVEEKGREGGASRKSEKIQLPFLPGKKSPRGVKSQGRLNSEDLQWWICEVLGAGHPVWKALPLWELGWRSWSHGGRELSVV